jgi:hypothetical protein
MRKVIFISMMIFANRFVDGVRSRRYHPCAIHC